MTNSINFEVKTTREDLETLLSAETNEFLISGKYELQGDQWVMNVTAYPADFAFKEGHTIGLCPTPCPPNTRTNPGSQF